MLRNYNRRIHAALSLLLWGLYCLGSTTNRYSDFTMLSAYLLLISALTVFLIQRRKAPFQKGALPPCWIDPEQKDALMILQKRPMKITFFLVLPMLVLAALFAAAFEAGWGSEYLFLMGAPLFPAALGIGWLLIVSPGIDRLTALLSELTPEKCAVRRAQWEDQRPFINPLRVYDSQWIAQNIDGHNNRGGSPQGYMIIFFRIANYLWHL